MKWAAGVGAASILLYATAIEPTQISVTNIVFNEGDLSKALDGCRVAFLSDLHFRDAGGPAPNLVLRQLDEIQPDLILLGGDFVEWGARGRAYDQALAFLAGLHAPLGVFAVLGDADATGARRSCEFCHEPGEPDRTSRHDVTFLRDQAAEIPARTGTLRIAGLDPKAHSHPDARLRSLIRGSGPTIVLSHSSTSFAEIAAAREILVLSGDTHGGQVWLPTWAWRLLRLLPDPSHPSGLYREDKKFLYVTRGIGTSRLPFRLGAPPEIVLFEFRRP
ncbi:MAG TPA: metallophosphoesterase [bacterium]